MRILIDKYIPFLQGVLDRFADVCFLEPEQFTPAAVRDADALIIRTRTRCDDRLLDGSRVRFIATATIGTDHIDLDYCRQQGINVVSCPGCNAQAVCDYVEEAVLDVLDLRTRHYTAHLSFGIVGAGHVGKRVIRMAGDHGFHVVVNDPPQNLNGNIFECDIISFHTPLTRDGHYPTYHLCNEAFLARCKPNALIINAARGGVVDEQALLRSTQPFVIDTWEGEPDINPEVLNRAMRASFHIAGYSVAGKRNASRMCLKALCEQFSFPKCKLNTTPLPQGDSEPGWLKRITDSLKANPTHFEQLRKAYVLR